MDQETLDGKLLLECLRSSSTLVRISELLDAGAEPSHHRRHSWFSGTPLGAVLDHSRDNTADLVRLLLEGGADPSIPTSGGRTPVNLAIKQQCMEAVFLLLEGGARLDTSEFEGASSPEGAMSTAIFARHRRPELVPLGEERAKMLAALEQDLKTLVELGADVGVASRAGTTALFRAAHVTPELVPLLLEFGAVLEHRDTQGRTALGWAAPYPFMVDGVRALLESGASVDALDDKGRTPLWHAVENMIEPSVRLLVAAGADPDHPDAEGESPRALARRRGLVILSTLLGDEVESLPWIDLIRGGIESGSELRAGEESISAGFRSNDETHFSHRHTGYPHWQAHTMRRMEAFVTERIAYLTLHRSSEILAYLREHFEEQAADLSSTAELVALVREQSSEIMRRAAIDDSDIQPAAVLVDALWEGLEYCERNDKEGWVTWSRRGDRICRVEGDPVAPGHETERSYTRAEAVVGLLNEAETVDGFVMPRQEHCLYGFRAALRLLGVPTFRAYAASRS